MLLLKPSIRMLCRWRQPRCCPWLLPLPLLLR
jgi:hypothetical protein